LLIKRDFAASNQFENLSEKLFTWLVSITLLNVVLLLKALAAREIPILAKICLMTLYKPAASVKDLLSIVDNVAVVIATNTRPNPIP